VVRKTRIKDIAAMSGVSVGTVDRVLHGRGKVSKDTLEAVEAVLKKVDYQPNIHVSAISLKKSFKIIVTTPIAAKGEYWYYIQSGILSALDKYSDIKIDCKYFYYDQYDIFSCRNAFSKIISEKPDAVIIGPTFSDVSLSLCNDLMDNDIPYVFVDSIIEGALPFSAFATDPSSCGRLCARLIDAITPRNSDLAVFQAIRIGDESANNTIWRKNGFICYIEKLNQNRKIYKIPFSVNNHDLNNKSVNDFFACHGNVRGVVTFNSHGHIIADCLRENGLNDIKLVCFDLTNQNRKYLDDGIIDFILSQRPENQGYEAISSIINFLVCKKRPETVINYMPIDILTRENMNYF